MLPIRFMAFAVFVACGIIQFSLNRSLRRRLVENHPDVWAEISRNAWLLGSALSRFIHSRKCKDFDDHELARAATRLRWVEAVTLGAWLVMAASICFRS